MKEYRKKEIMELFALAEQEKFAIPAFNYTDIWDMMAIVEAAKEEHAPVMLMAEPLIYESIGLELYAPMIKVMEQKASVPIIHHLDHAVRQEFCIQAADLGFGSVMMDASDKPIDRNIEIVRTVAEYAHQKGCVVEAEIGRILGDSEVEASYTGDDYLFDLDEALRLVDEAKPDLLAIGIGNAHGFYKGRPKLNFDKLAQAKEAIDIPLVLHGGTGIPESDIKRAVKEGIRKVNVGTAIYTAYMNGIRKKLMEEGENQFTLDVMRYGMERIKMVVKEWIRVCMADNRV